MVTPIPNLLSLEERRLLYLVALGNSNKEIGEQLSLPATVIRAKIKGIQRTLGVQSRTASPIGILCV